MAGLLRRNQEILQAQFKNRLTDTRIWPISSANLLQVVQTDDEDYLVVSRYRQLWAALQVFLFHVAGWDRSAKAISETENSSLLARKTLAGRLAALTEESEQKRTEIQQRITQRKRQFDSEWGMGAYVVAERSGADIASGVGAEYGQKRAELMETVRKITDAGKQTFLQALQPGSELETAACSKIDGLKSVDEAKQYSNIMDGEVIAAFIEKWRSVRQQVERQCYDLLVQFLAIANSLSFPEETSSASLTFRHARTLTVKNDWSSIIGEADKERGPVEIIARIFLPNVASIVALCWAGIRALFVIKRKQLEAARQELHTRLDTVLQSVRQQFWGVDLTFGYQSCVDTYFDALTRLMSEQVQKIATRKSAESQVELDHLAEEAKLDEQERKTKIDQAQQQVAEWDAISQSIKDIVSDLKILEQSLELFSA